MQITGEQFFYLVQVLKDSLDIQLGYDWSFHSKRDSRQDFYRQLLKSIMVQDKIEIADPDLVKLKKLID